MNSNDPVHNNNIDKTENWIERRQPIWWPPCLPDLKDYVLC